MKGRNVKNEKGEYRSGARHLERLLFTKNTQIEIIISDIKV